MMAAWFGSVGRIVKVNGTTPGPMEGITYDVIVADGRVRADLVSVAPARAWPVGTRVNAAIVNDPCVVRTMPGQPVKLIVWTEWPEPDECP